MKRELPTSGYGALAGAVLAKRLHRDPSPAEIMDRIHAATRLGTHESDQTQPDNGEVLKAANINGDTATLVFFRKYGNDKGFRTVILSRDGRTWKVTMTFKAPFDENSLPTMDKRDKRDVIARIAEEREARAQKQREARERAMGHCPTAPAKPITRPTATITTLERIRREDEIARLTKEQARLRRELLECQRRINDIQSN